MKKTFIAIAAIVAITAGSCKKEGAVKPAKLKIKSTSDIKDHTGWDNTDPNGDATATANAAFRPATKVDSTTTTAKKAKKIK